MSELVWIHRFNENELGLGARGAFCVVPIEARKIFFPNKDFENNPDINETINLVFQVDQKSYSVTYSKPPSKTEHRLSLAGLTGDIGQIGSNKIITPGKIGCFYRKENILFFSVAKEGSVYDDLLKKFPSRGKDNNVVTRTVIESTDHETIIDDYIKKNNKINSKQFREFALNVFKYFYDNKWNLILDNSEVGESTINDCKYKVIHFEKFKRLIGEFNKVMDTDGLTSSGTQRFFETPIYANQDKHYFSTQWYGQGGYDLTFDNLKNFIEKEFANYQIKKIDKHYYLSLVSIPLSVDSFKKSCNSSGLIYTKQLITRYIASLTTKPFVLLGGLSGSGKTKLAQSFAQWICADKSQYKIIPVGADWTNREPLLGYVDALCNAKYVLPENGALELIIEANNNVKKPYFLILDEMNLSHVERYFADFLSVMESKEKFKLHSSDKPLESQSDVFVHKEYEWPKNLFVVGTVNIDETTYMFSPKVLDRANVIEFRVTGSEIKIFLDDNKEVTDLNGEGQTMAADFIDIANKNDSIKLDKLNKTLIQFFKELQKVGAEFGYRTASKIQTLFSKLERVNPEYSNIEDEKIDIAIMQKLLPKLHGSRRKLCPVLEILAEFCVKFDKKDTKESKDKLMKSYFGFKEPINYKDNHQIKYPISLEKILRMYKGAIDNGFASYAEA